MELMIAMIILGSVLILNVFTNSILDKILERKLKEIDKNYKKSLDDDYVMESIKAGDLIYKIKRY